MSSNDSHDNVAICSKSVVSFCKHGIMYTICNQNPIFDYISGMFCSSKHNIMIALFNAGRENFNAETIHTHYSYNNGIAKTVLFDSTTFSDVERCFGVLHVLCITLFTTSRIVQTSNYNFSQNKRKIDVN